MPKNKNRIAVLVVEDVPQVRATAVRIMEDLGCEAFDAYNGQQGDIWDAQKDMALAGFGALLCMLITALGHRLRGRQPVLLAGTTSVLK